MNSTRSIVQFRTKISIICHRITQPVTAQRLTTTPLCPRGQLEISYVPQLAFSNLHHLLSCVVCKGVLCGGAWKWDGIRDAIEEETEQPLSVEQGRKKRVALWRARPVFGLFCCEGVWPTPSGRRSNPAEFSVVLSAFSLSGCCGPDWWRTPCTYAT